MNLLCEFGWMSSTSLLILSHISQLLPTLAPHLPPRTASLDFLSWRSLPRIVVGNTDRNGDIWRAQSWIAALWRAYLLVWAA